MGAVRWPRGWRGLLGRLEPPFGADPLAVLQVSAFPRPWSRPPALCGPRALPSGSRRRSPAGLLSWPCGAGTGSRLPGARAVRGDGPGRVSPPPPGFAARCSPPRRWELPAVPPGTGARPGRGRFALRGAAGGGRSGKSTGLPGPASAPGAQHGAPVLPVPPGFS